MIRWAAPGPYEVAFSTRVGGVSRGPFESLNLGRMTGDVPERVDRAFDAFHAQTISGKIWRPEARALAYRGAQDST